MFRDADKTMSHKFRIPSMTFIGEGSLLSAENEICKLGTKALIVTGKSMIRQGHIDKLISMLSNHNIDSCIFSDVPSEPTDKMIEAGVVVYKQNSCNFIIGFGGGSPLDSAKAIGAMITNPGRIADYNGKVITNPLPPLVAIPSTAGTGSEVTPFTIIADTEHDIKMLLKGDVVMPTIAVVDPEFSMQTPRNVTVATGLDALTHAVEAFSSKKAFCESDIFALSAIKRIFRNLPLVLDNPNDAAAREQMSIAAYEAGISFSNSSVTVVHGMSRPIGALFHVAHGISNAMLLKDCLAYVADGAYDRFSILGREIGVACEEDSDVVATDKFIKAVFNLCELCEVPTLEQYGIDRERFFALMDKMAVDALDSGSPANTRKPLAKEDILNIYRKLWD